MRITSHHGDRGRRGRGVRGMSSVVWRKFWCFPYTTSASDSLQNLLNFYYSLIVKFIMRWKVANFHLLTWRFYEEQLYALRNAENDRKQKKRECAMNENKDKSKILKFEKAVKEQTNEMKLRCDWWFFEFHVF